MAVPDQTKTQSASETFTFAELPKNADELRSLPEAALDTPYKTAALTLAALCRFGEDESAAHEMLDWLKGPESLSNLEKQFLRDRLKGKAYKSFSFFEGASVENGYTPSRPYRITVSSNPYSFDTENWAVLYVKSAGADSPRSVKLRRKPSTGQWFLNEIQCLADIRLPAQIDPWA
ncbi:MAG: hypothetical protein J5827_03975 [Oscillospiraceae bacterium]|nr:hypothetical protein [Oscillospiraceae bacterium]